MTKKEFIQSVGARRFGLHTYIKSLEVEGLEKADIQSVLLKDRIVPSARTLTDEWRMYEKYKTQINWING